MQQGVLQFRRRHAGQNVRQEAVVARPQAEQFVPSVHS